MSKDLLITADNVRHHASFIHSTVNVEKRLIHFNSGTLRGEEILRVPLAELGEIKPHSSIRITVALRPGAPTTDSDPYVGITDGSTTNAFILRDPANFPHFSPCQPNNAEQDDTRVRGDEKQASVYML